MVVASLLAGSTLTGQLSWQGALAGPAATSALTQALPTPGVRCMGVPLRPGCIETLAGNLHEPACLAVDASGNVFIADTGDTVVKETPVGTHTLVTVAGGGSDDVAQGSPTDIALNSPAGVAVGEQGDLFVADTNGQRVLEVTPDLHSFTTVAGDDASDLVDDVNYAIGGDSGPNKGQALHARMGPSAIPWTAPATPASPMAMSCARSTRATHGTSTRSPATPVRRGFGRRWWTRHPGPTRRPRQSGLRRRWQPLHRR